MGAASLDLEIEQGASFERVLTVRDSLNAPIILTGWVFRGQVRRTYSSEEILASFTCTVLDQVTDPGKMTIRLTAAETSAIPVESAIGPNLREVRYLYDLEADAGGGTVYRILQGGAVISPEVTRT